MPKNKKNIVNVDKGRIYITATYNNTLVTITDQAGKPFMVAGCGMYGFSGTRKSTPYAATVTVQTTLKKATLEHGLREVDIYVKGIGPGREASLRAVKGTGVEVNRILDITPVPHNGVRPPKIRRG